MSNRVLILSGPTHEYLDPVRFIGNASSGKMGKALAEEALRRGMDVIFISGPVPEGNLPNADAASSPHPGGEENTAGTPRLQIQHVISAEEMLAAAQAEFAEANLIIFAAAVADYQPAKQSAEKLPKVGTNITLELKPTPDIAATLCATKRPDQRAVGFALQTHDGEAKAREKRNSKHLDGIVLNTPATLGAENGIFIWIDDDGLEDWGALSKTECARRIFAKAAPVSPPVKRAGF